ncbi:unnamed protein product [Linum tenue]|uniref:Uncharacterized protein n=1 Tax=Linum tenue TaxID=586396 RepID=A0AAV0JLR7_9ROSI|nr:unnamed protein product [Linum tenue]
MEDNCSPHSAIGWGSFYQDEQVIEEFKQYVLYTSELETTIVSAREEIANRDLEILHLKELLSNTTKERNEARLQCQKLILDKSTLQQQQQQQLLLLHHLKLKHKEAEEEATAPASVSSGASITPDEQLAAPAAIEGSPAETQQRCGAEVDDVVEKLAADRTLPEKGKLLQAVKDAGPLLQTLLLAGPLPQWQHPPPQLDAIEIPPVTIPSSSLSSPAAAAAAVGRLIHQESFSSSSSPPSNACFGVKRSLELCDSPASPNKKCHKLDLLH